VLSILKLLIPFNTDAKLKRALIREAWRRDMTIDEFSDTVTAKELSDIVERVTPSPDLTPWGLVPQAALVDEPSTGIPPIDSAADAAASGVWKPAAALLADSYRQWDYRAGAVMSLARVAANEDEWLAAWRAAEPDNAHIDVVDCAALTQLAWQLRGTKRAAETSAEQVADFHRVLVRAEAAANRATRLLPDDPTAWFTLLIIARGRGYDRARFDEVWQGLTERAPLHRRAHSSALQYRCAKWCGSHEQMFDFAERAATLSPSLSLLVVQVASEKEADDPKVWQQSKVRDAVDTFVNWLGTNGPDTVDLRDDLGWAALGLVKIGRGAEAIPLFQRLGPHAGGLPWSYAYNPIGMFNDYRIEACKLAKR
jgi:hypothetical protein